MSDLSRLAADLEHGSRTINARAEAVVSRGLLNIKRDWQDGWSGLAHAPLLPKAISYDLDVTAGHIEGVVGPDKDKPQGALGNLVEFGSVNNEPNSAGMRALDHEEPRFVAALAALADPLGGLL